MKFDIEMVCTKKIIMTYISLENFSKKGFYGEPPSPVIFFFFFLSDYNKIWDISC